MKLLEKHNKRVKKVKEYTGKNKVFVITALVAIVFLLYNFVFVSKDNPQIEKQHQQVIISDTSEQESEEVTTGTVSKRETWRFYFIDLIILGSVGGLCLIMIIRERRKVKEELK
jgi:sugar phosphate permease